MTVQHPGTLPALARTVADICDEYNSKVAALPETLLEFECAVDRLESATSINGQYSHYDIFGRSGRPRPDERAIRKALCVSGWRSIYDRLNIDRIATARDRDLFRQTLSDPPPLEFDTAKATFGKYLANPRHHILRGVAECFVGLDPAYKSHSKVKIGVSGLPKRIILENMRGSGSSGFDKLRDVLHALAMYRDEPLPDRGVFHALERQTSTIYPNKPGDVIVCGQTVRVYKNGNAHLIFEKQALLDINRALAEFYGDALPDVEPDEAEKRPGTEVARDLQYYPTPAAVIDEALHRADVPTAAERKRAAGYDRAYPVRRVLEPSCGDGRIMDALRERGESVFGIECHAGRAAEARAKGHPVLTANFLECAPSQEFDLVVMNPPFYGRHYAKHVRHAFKFLKPGCQLVAILPATAHYDHEELMDLPNYRWSDLPVASFAESGTNVPTGILTARKGRA